MEILLVVKLMDWPMHENHENKYPTNNSDFAVISNQVLKLNNLHQMIKSRFQV
jgi:hypothetical protein